MSVLLRGFLSVPLMVLTCENKEIISRVVNSLLHLLLIQKNKTVFKLNRSLKRKKTKIKAFSSSLLLSKLYPPLTLEVPAEGFESDADCSAALVVLLEHVTAPFLSVQASIYTFRFLYTTRINAAAASLRRATDVCATFVSFVSLPAHQEGEKEKLLSENEL